MIPAAAFRAGTQALRQRLANLERPPCYRSAQAPAPSPPGIGTSPDPATGENGQGDAAAASAAIRHRINALDPSRNDRRQRLKIASGGVIGARVEHAATARDERVAAPAHGPHPGLLPHPRQRQWLDAGPVDLAAAGRRLSRRKDRARPAGRGRHGFRFLPLPRHRTMAAASARPRPGEGPLVRVARRAIPFARSTAGVTPAGSGLRETGRLAETTAAGPAQPWSAARYASLGGGG